MEEKHAGPALPLCLSLWLPPSLSLTLSFSPFLLSLLFFTYSLSFLLLFYVYTFRHIHTYSIYMYMCAYTCAVLSQAAVSLPPAKGSEWYIPSLYYFSALSAFPANRQCVCGCVGACVVGTEKALLLSGAFTANLLPLHLTV